jgi:hypothetical protein
VNEPMDKPDDVVRQAEQIISMFEDRPDLFLAACADPVRAMRDVGIELSPSAARYVAHRCRFSPKEADELERLASHIDEQLGIIDPDDDRAVAAALRKVGVDVSRTKRPTAEDAAQQAAPASTPPSNSKGTSAVPEVHPMRRSVLAAAATLPQVRRWRPVRRVEPDPFERYREAHDVMAPLLEYRRRSATQIRFADSEVYERLAHTSDGQVTEAINLTLRVRLNRGG